MVKFKNDNFFTQRECLYLALFPYQRDNQSPPIPHTQIDNPISYLGTDLTIMNQSVLKHYDPFEENADGDLAKALKLYCANGICPEDEVKWLYSATYFELIFINHTVAQSCTRFQTYPTTPLTDSASTLYQSGYPPLLLDSNVEDLVTRIILLIDLCIFGTIEGKISFLKNIKKNTETAKSKVSGTLYLKEGVPKDLLSEFIACASNYQKKFYQERSKLLFLPEPDKYALDRLIANCMIKTIEEPSFYDLFELKLKKAWSQKKHKIKNVEKIARSYLFSKETISMLDELGNDRGRSKTEVLESLIKEAHEEYLTSIKKPARR